MSLFMALPHSTPAAKAWGNPHHKDLMVNRAITPRGGCRARNAAPERLF
jgi:hypothetical protein